MGAPKMEKCSCPESQHLRRALKAIRKIATSDTGWAMVDDLAQTGNLADQALRLTKLEGDPGVGDVGPFLEPV